MGSDDQGRFFISLGDNGEYVKIDLHTGQEVPLVDKFQSINQMLDTNKFIKVRTEADELVYVPKNLPKADFENIVAGAKREDWPYTELIADRICTLIAEGDTLAGVARREGYPSYSVIARWRRQHPEFEEAYKQARKDRAEIYFDRIMREIEKAKADRDEIALARLKTDLLKFAAKVCAPDDYTEKQAVDARVAVGTFSIETGIRREGDEGFNKDHTKEISDAEDVIGSE